LQNILGTDPYGQCTYKSPVGSASCPSADPIRFTLTLNQDLQYLQPAVGGQPFTQRYTESYTTATSTQTSYKKTTSQAFGWERSFSGSIFENGVTVTFKKTQTLEWTHEGSNKFETSTMSTASASITGPPCHVVNGACSPVYPPANAYNTLQGASCTALALPRADGQAQVFDLYQDNSFGGFLFFPLQY
jgi:hypothetical protein